MTCKMENFVTRRRDPDFHVDLKWLKSEWNKLRNLSPTYIQEENNGDDVIIRPIKGNMGILCRKQESAYGLNLAFPLGASNPKVNLHTMICM